MKPILFKVFSRAGDLADVEPLIALFLGAALLAVFLSALFQSRPAVDRASQSSLVWTIYGHGARLLWAVALVAFLVGVVSMMRIYLRQTVTHFQRTHGRITQANYNAVQTIWGSEQAQGELNVQMFDDVEVTERIESEDLTKPAVLRKKTVRKFVTGNPFVSARHNVTLEQNPRKKGSAYYVGYETDCRFAWQLKNPTDAAHHCQLTFPLPASGAMYDALTATLNGADVLPEMQIKNNSLVLDRVVKPDEGMNFRMTFKSRGVSFWYFQVREAREIRDFTLTLSLPDLPQARLNYPEGCMTPTGIEPTTNGQGSVLTFRLDHALSNQGMGIALPKLPQPGATTNAVLHETDRAWLLIFAMLSLSLTLASVRHAVLLTAMFSIALAFVYGLVANFSDLLFGFWGTSVLVLLPLILILAVLLKRVARGWAGKWMALQMTVFGLAYPVLAGMDDKRQMLYLNLCALGLLAFVTWLLAEKFRKNPNVAETSISAAQAA